MSGSTLRDFASAAVQSKRIRFGDLRRLKRDILPARITACRVRADIAPSRAARAAWLRNGPSQTK